MLLQPRKLSPGDRVSVVAPGGPIDRERFEAGAAKLRALDLTPVYDERLFARDAYLAGPDAQRLALLQTALDDPSTRAVWAARGGYGLTRILPELRLRGLRESSKLVIGFSDVTALHAALGALGAGSLHGPNVGQVGELTPRALERLATTVFSSFPPPALSGAVPLRPGKAGGVLLGGNLTLLAALAGTSQLPSFAGAILLLEDIGERPYRLDRSLTQLRSVGAFDGLRGLALGTFERCEDALAGSSPGTSAAGTVRQVFERFAEALGIPAAIGFPIGHIDDNCAVPLGSEVELDAGAGQLTFVSGLRA
jgi:muramoyltetrapeptide carboxypeptidase